MKPETEKGLREASAETQQAIITLLAEIMPQDLFVGALLDSDEDITAKGLEIYDVMSDHVEQDPVIESGNASRLHDAICEGRRQDAIDILSEITGERFNSVREMHNLFGDRVPA